MGGLTILDLSEAKRALPPPPSIPRAIIRAAEAGPLFPFQSGMDAGFRRLSQSPNERDLYPFAQDRMQRIAYYLYVTNNVASRCVEILVDFICGEGVRVKAKDGNVQAELDAFWNDPWNNMDEFIPQLVQEQSVFGEALIECYANPINGNTRIAAIDPIWIESVEYATLEGDPGRACGPPMTVILRRGPQGPKGRRLRVVQVEEDPFSVSYGQLIGECFYWPLRKACAGTRGISDLFRGADLYGAHEAFIWAAVEQAKAHGAFIWDVEMAGATQEQMDEWLRKNPAGPRTGGVRVHNEGMKWTAVSPQLNAGDKSEIGRMIRNAVIAGFGFPEHWFADGGNANRATAAEMGEPVLKMLSRRQRSVKFMIADILRYVISNKIAAGVLRESVNQEFDVQMPELSVRDQQKIAAAIQTTAQGLSLSKAEGIVDARTSANVLAIQLQQLGVEVDAADMLQKASAEKEAELLRDYRNSAPEPKADGEGLGQGEPTEEAGK